MPGITHLGRLLAELRPRVLAGRYVVATVPALPAGLTPAAVVTEDEGVTVVVDVATAAAHGLAGEVELGWITLTVHSSLVAVGLTASVAGALAEAGISGNVLAGYHHDHVLVPVTDVDRAVAVLTRLSESARRYTGSSDSSAE